MRSSVLDIQRCACLWRMFGGGVLEAIGYQSLELKIAFRDKGFVNVVKVVIKTLGSPEVLCLHSTHPAMRRRTEEEENVTQMKPKKEG